MIYVDRDTKRIICDVLKESLLNHIKEHFDLLIPFEVHKGVYFDVRISPEEYDSLSKEDIYDLDLCSRMDYPDGLPDELIDRYIKDHYWLNCKEYIYKYKIKDAYGLKARCKYGYNGIEESIDFVFIKKDYYPEIVMKYLMKTE